jgi:hypothetical protein
MAVAVTIDYRLVGQAKWERIVVPPSEYFDVDEEPLDVDSVAQNNHAIDYVSGVPHSDIEATRLTIMNDSVGNSRTITEMFWNGGENRIIERTDLSDGACNYWELILDVLVSDEPCVYEIMRMGRLDGILQVLSHVFIERRSDGSEQERVVFSRC